MALRDRAKLGGSYHVHSSLVAVNTTALRPEIGLYSPEIVKQCQERFNWAPMRGAHHVFELLFNVWDGWKRFFGAKLDEDGGLFVSYQKSAFGGRRLSMLKPCVTMPGAEKVEWRTGSVPFCYEKKEDVKWES